MKNKNIRIKEKFGLIGVGNMGSSILEGLFQKGIANPSQVRVYDKMPAKSRVFCKRWKTKTADSVHALIEQSDVVLLAFKPQDLSSLAGESEAFVSRQVVISILAGTPIERVAQFVGAKPKIVRAMPNLGATVGEAVTAVAGSDPKSLRLAEKIFSGCGRTVCLPENVFDAATAVSGNGPAYFFLLMEFLIKEAVERGIDEKRARVMVIQTAVAAAQLAKTSPETPGELRQRVTSKGGMTEAALRSLEKADFSGIFHNAIHAAVLRGKELSQGMS